jgi:hypothetical protein
LALCGCPCSAQFATKLQARTDEEFRSYAAAVEKQVTERWEGKRSFLALDEVDGERAKVLQGAFWISRGAGDEAPQVYKGSVADWVGAVFIPGVDPRAVVELLADFNRHAKVYPEVTRSRTLRKDGDLSSLGYWRLERRNLGVPVVLDVEQKAEYERAGEGRWSGRSYTTKISEVSHAGSDHEAVSRPGEGDGFLWRMDAYWTLERVNGGVLAECRVVSLSRDIPSVLAWIIKPLVSQIPYDALTSTLQNTRAAVSK